MFKRKKKGEAVSEKAAGMIAGTILAMQRGFAEWMGRSTASFGHGGKIGLLVIVCVVFGGLSVASLVKVFTGSGESESWKPSDVRVPGYYNKTGDASSNDVAIVSPSAYMKMRAFRRYMDSLKRTAAGKLEYERIMKARPGLMDSVLFLEELYHSQQNGEYGK
jgi:hypothetical protein